jgi:hypothetical protein
VVDAPAEGVGVYDQSLGGSPKYSVQGVGVDRDNHRVCLEDMSEFDEETSGLEGWLKEDVGYLLDFSIFVLVVRSLTLGSFKFF